jgi:Leucine rich repeat N-terminal domain
VFWEERVETCTVAPTAAPTFIPATYDDGAALCTVYRALTAKSGLTRWCSGSGQYNPCLSWAGVTCTNGRVTKLELGYKDLTGPLSSAIGNLGAMTYISFRMNGLRGSLPSQLGQLKNLRELYLDDNQFTSAVPASFCDFSKSIDLQLNGNPGLTCLPSCLTSGSYQKLTEGREKIRALYEAVTSIHVKVGDTDESFVCTSRNETKKRVSRFKLERSDPNLIKFTPTANAELFPEHLQQSIEIAASHCPLLLTDLLGAQQQE